jgi:hypothetical protein
MALALRLVHNDFIYFFNSNDDKPSHQPLVDPRHYSGH